MQRQKTVTSNFGRKRVIDIFGTFKTSFIMCISILSQFRCFSEKIMGGLNRNFEKPRGNQGRTPYNTSYGSFALFGTLKLSYSILPLFNCTSKISYGYGLELYGVLPFFFLLYAAFKGDLLCKNHFYKRCLNSCVASVCENNQPIMVKIHPLIYL